MKRKARTKTRSSRSAAQRIRLDGHHRERSRSPKSQGGLPPLCVFLCDLCVQSSAFFHLDPSTSFHQGQSKVTNAEFAEEDAEVGGSRWSAELLEYSLSHWVVRDV